MVSRKGTYSCPVASGVIYAVNVNVRRHIGAPLGAYNKALLASMQARPPIWARQAARMRVLGRMCRAGGMQAVSGVQLGESCWRVLVAGAGGVCYIRVRKFQGHHS